MMALDEGKLNEFMGRFVTDASGAAAAVLTLVGDRLGLYQALSAGGPATPGELARRTGLSERYLREWLNCQAAGGYASYDADSGRYALSPEQAFALADPASPAYVGGIFQILAAMWHAEPAIEEKFKTGGGIPWGAQHPCLFEGTERFFRAGYTANLIDSWIPALDGVKGKLERGASVADVGCGLGASTLIMARAFPRSRFIGFDSHPGSIELARQRARAAGLGDQVRFEVASSTDFAGTGYDLCAHFDCLHDMEDPDGAARHVRKSLATDGTWMIVEPFAGDRPEENHNPVGRLFYAASTMLCVPHSLSQQGPALGAQAGEARLRRVVVEGGGFRSLRRATQTPFNLVLEARP